MVHRRNLADNRDQRAVYLGWRSAAIHSAATSVRGRQRGRSDASRKARIDGLLEGIGMGDTGVLHRSCHKNLRILLSPRSLSEKQYSKRYASLVECKDVNNSTTKSRLL